MILPIFILLVIETVGVRHEADLVEDLIKIGGLLSSLIVAMIGGIAAAYHYLRRKIDTVSEQVVPGAHPYPDNTLRDKVDMIAATLEAERKERLQQHQANTDRLDNFECALEELHKENTAQRSLLDKILSKLARL